VKKSKARLMAEAFLFGATAGDWVMSAEIADYETIPERTNIFIAREMEKLSEKAERFDEVEKVAKRKGKVDWDEAADSISPLLVQIAAGEVKATPAQQRAIEAIIVRGKGKVVEKQRKLIAPGIVILPALGLRENTKLCPNCMEEVE